MLGASKNKDCQLPEKLIRIPIIHQYLYLAKWQQNFLYEVGVVVRHLGYCSSKAAVSYIPTLAQVGKSL